MVIIISTNYKKILKLQKKNVIENGNENIKKNYKRIRT